MRLREVLPLFVLVEAGLFQGSDMPIWEQKRRTEQETCFQELLATSASGTYNIFEVIVMKTPPSKFTGTMIDSLIVLRYGKPT